MRVCKNENLLRLSIPTDWQLCQRRKRAKKPMQLFISIFNYLTGWYPELVFLSAVISNSTVSAVLITNTSVFETLLTL